MKYLTITLLFLSLLSTPVFGRLGDGEGTAGNRYGNPEQVDFINFNRDATATYYLKDNTLTIKTVNK